jgi:DNA-binding LytR/AlgR family response regulator
MNTIIIDDDDASREALIKQISGLDNFNLVITGVFSSAKEALNKIANDDIQIIFLDVEMPEMSGLEFLSSLEIKPQVILTTSHKKYAFDAFDYEVADYLLKPVSLPRLIKAIAKAEKKLQKTSIFDVSKNNEYFFIKSESAIIKILVKDVLWIEALGDYVKVHTRDKTHILHVTLRKLESKLPRDKFFRAHRSFIVQLDNIRNVEYNSIYITDIPIPIGAVYKDNFLERLNLLT